jgi:hypothetical protein
MTDPAVGELPFAKVEVMIIKLRLKKIHQSWLGNWQGVLSQHEESTVTSCKVSYHMLLYHRTKVWGKYIDGKV